MRRQLNVPKRPISNTVFCLGHNIRVFRQRANMSQSSLAGILRVTPQAVSKWERGIALPDIELLIPLADIFSVSLDELLGRDGYV